MLGPDVEYIISRAQAIQAGSDSPVLTAEHLHAAIDSLPGGAGAGGDGGLTKEELESTMKQMLMVSTEGHLQGGLLQKVGEAVVCESSGTTWGVAVCGGLNMCAS